jgi:hypothetical protein
MGFILDLLVNFLKIIFTVNYYHVWCYYIYLNKQFQILRYQVSAEFQTYRLGPLLYKNLQP